jgi:hypothetical protein
MAPGHCGTTGDRKSISGINLKAGLGLVDAWTEQAERADIEGGDSLRIYNVNLEHGEVIREI